MTEIQNNNLSKIKAFKVSRKGNLNGPFHITWERSFDEKYDYQFGHGSYLYELFLCINDFGVLVNMSLHRGENYFSGNAYCAEITGTNKIKFQDYEESFSYEMDFDEFLRVNKAFLELDRAQANDIWFKIIDGKIALEGIWLKQNIDVASK